MVIIRPGWIIILKSKGQNYPLTTKINLLCDIKFEIHYMTAVWFWLFVLGLLFKNLFYFYFILILVLVIPVKI